MVEKEVKISKQEECNVYYSLIDRLQVVAELKYPTKIWCSKYRSVVACTWVNRKEKLLEIILNLEEEIKLNDYDKRKI